MVNRKTMILLLLFITVLLAVPASVVAKKTKMKQSYSMILRQKETNAVEFVRLVVMRLIYGIAKRLGFGEQISDALNGAFVPPGVDDEYGDYTDFGLFDRDDDDYDYR